MKVIALKNIILEKNTITYKFDIPEELRKHINMEYIDEHNQGTLFVRPQKRNKIGRNSKIYIVDSVYWDDDGNCNVVSNSY